MSFYHNTNIEVEVGDFIKIAKPYRKCKYKSKVYQINSISNSGKSVWYNDNRTNNKCKCGRCIELEKNNKVNMTLAEIKLLRKLTEHVRETKLRLLLKED